jgi:hypothetical protein
VGKVRICPRGPNQRSHVAQMRHDEPVNEIDNTAPLAYILLNVGRRDPGVYTPSPNITHY